MWSMCKYYNLKLCMTIWENIFWGNNNENIHILKKILQIFLKSLDGKEFCRRS